MNDYRKAKKSYDLANHYYYRKKDYNKALINYVRSMIDGTRFTSSEEILFLIWDCYWCIWKYEQALAYANKSLEISAWYLPSMNLKGLILKEMWKTKESQELLKEYDEIIEKLKNQKLDLDAFYNKK